MSLLHPPIDVRHLLDRAAIRDVMARYFLGIDRAEPALVRSCFTADVKAQYDGRTPACVHVNQDGIQFDAPKVFDRLIHEGKMPMTIGVFVMHGRVKAPSTNALDRFNRSYEYDGLGGDYAKFLLDELLPFIEATHAVKLSKNGTDRAIGGSSSGATALRKPFISPALLIRARAMQASIQQPISQATPLPSTGSMPQSRMVSIA